jgi:hypothetical protein
VDLRVRQVQVRRVERGLRGLHLRVGVGEVGRRVVDVLLRDHPRLEQALVAVELDAVVIAGDPRALEVGLRRLDGRVVFGRLDGEEQVARLHARAVLVVLRPEEPADARADVRVVVPVERADRLDVQRDVALRDRRDVHRGRRGRGRRALLLVAGGGEQHEGDRDGFQRFQ